MAAARPSRPSDDDTVVLVPAGGPIGRLERQIAHTTAVLRREQDETDAQNQQGLHIEATLRLDWGGVGAPQEAGGGGGGGGGALPLTTEAEASRPSFHSENPIALGIATALKTTEATYIKLKRGDTRSSRRLNWYLQLCTDVNAAEQYIAAVILFTAGDLNWRNLRFSDWKLSSLAFKFLTTLHQEAGLTSAKPTPNIVAEEVYAFVYDLAFKLNPTAAGAFIVGTDRRERQVTAGFNAQHVSDRLEAVALFRFWDWENSTAAAMGDVQGMLFDPFYNLTPP